MKKSKARKSPARKSASRKAKSTSASRTGKTPGAAGRTSARRATGTGKPQRAAGRNKAQAAGSKTQPQQSAESPSQLIDGRIRELGDWRGQILGRIRALIKEADPEVVEEWKWRGVPVWSHEGIICTGETYTNVVKMTFLNGASLEDPSHLFNSSLEGNTRRAIDVHQGESINEDALKTLIRAAVSFNQAKGRR